VSARPADDAFGLTGIGDVGGHEEEAIAAVAVANSHQASRMPVDGHYPMAGREQRAGAREPVVGPGFGDQNHRAASEGVRVGCHGLSQRSRHKRALCRGCEIAVIFTLGHEFCRLTPFVQLGVAPLSRAAE
jgi:hypothetical protein